MVDKYGNPWPKYRVYPPEILSPMRAVRHKCLDCCCESSMEVESYPVRDCPLWPYRFGTYPAGHKGPRSVLKFIKAKCKNCLPEPRQAVRDCRKICCPVYPYRLGTNPRRKGQASANIARLSRKAPPQKHNSEGRVEPQIKHREKRRVLKFYFGLVLLFFVVLLVEWAKRTDNAPFWVVVVGALFWPLTLGVLLGDLWRRS